MKTMTTRSAMMTSTLRFRQNFKLNSENLNYYYVVTLLKNFNSTRWPGATRKSQRLKSKSYLTFRVNPCPHGRHAKWYPLKFWTFNRWTKNSLGVIIGPTINRETEHQQSTAITLEKQMSYIMRDVELLLGFAMPKKKMFTLDSTYLCNWLCHAKFQSSTITCASTWLDDPL